VLTSLYLFEVTILFTFVEHIFNLHTKHAEHITAYYLIITSILLII